jgi:hypothetical protein
VRWRSQQACIGILENRDWEAGITEMPRIIPPRTRGIEGLIGDPRDLVAPGEGFCFAGNP